MPTVELFIWVKYSLDLRLDIKGLCSSLQPPKKSLHLRENLIYLYTLADIKELVNLDADLEHLEDLPAPLLPQNLDEKQKSVHFCSFLALLTHYRDKRCFYPQNGICNQEYHFWSKMMVVSAPDIFF